MRRNHRDNLPTRAIAARAYSTLTNAMLHCRFGSGSVDRIPDLGDKLAVDVLLQARLRLVREESDNGPKS